MKKDGNRKDGNKRTNVMGNPRYREYDLTNLDNYEPDYEMDWANKIEKILEIPGIEDMGGVFIRGRFKNERSLNAHLRLMYRHQKFGDTDHQELLRAKIAGSAAIGGVGRLEGVFMGTNLLASDMYRVALGMPKAKKGEERVMRGSDFRSEQRPQESLGER